MRRRLGPCRIEPTLTEVYNLGLTVSGASAGANFGLAAGTWTASLASGAFNHGAYVYMDGQAGKVWRVETDFTQSGAAHGQLYCYHYIAALQDASGNLGGFRHVAKVTQPWYNYDTLAKNWRSFANPIAVAWTGGSGGSVNMPWPFSAANFTASSGSQTFTATAATNWAVGAPDLNLVPGYVTGSLDGALSSSRIYWAATGPSLSTTTFQLWTQANSGPVTASGGGGTMTFTPVPNVLHFGSLFTLTTAARWTFIAGAGSFAADATLRTQFDTAYFHKTGMLPPLTLTQTPSDINATWLSSNPLWSPTSSGPVKQAIGAGGDDASIGMLTDWQVVHFFNQSAAGEQVVRTIGYANAFSSISLRDLTTRNLANISGNSYTGMPASNPNLQWNAENVYASGFTAPPAGNSNFMWGENNTTHKPPFAYYAALVFGGPDLLDLVIENANGGALEQDPSQRNWTTPYTVDGVILAAPDGELARGPAWAYRDRHFAAALAPASHPDGSQVSQYTAAVALADSAYMIAVISATYTNAYAVAIGLHYFVESFGPSQVNAASGAGFTMAYFACAVAFAACARLRDANAQSFVSLGRRSSRT